MNKILKKIITYLLKLAKKNKLKKKIGKKRNKNEILEKVMLLLSNKFC